MQTMTCSHCANRPKHLLIALLTAFLLAPGAPSTAQQTASSNQAASPQITLGELVRTLPDYMQPGPPQPAYLSAIEDASDAEREAALVPLMQWIGDERPKVRGFALLTLGLLYMPSEKRPSPGNTVSLPARYVPAVASHLLDPDPSNRNVTLLALNSVEYHGGEGLEQLTALVLPMLRQPDVLTEYPDPFFIESDKQILSHMTPEQQAQFKAHTRKVMKLPAIGPQLLAILTMPTRQPTAPVDDAMIAFLDRDDQTQSTLADCLHTLALSAPGERVNDEALRRVFEQKAMTIFLLQFVAEMRLTPKQLAAQKQRLLALANDGDAHPALRRSAQDVAACWTGQRTGNCKPNSQDLSQQLDTR